MKTITTQLLALLLALCAVGHAQDEPAPDAEPASVSGKLVIETSGAQRKMTPLYKAEATSQIRVTGNAVTHAVQAKITVLQGAPEKLTLALNGAGTVTNVAGEGITGWAVRQTTGENPRRLLDIWIAKSDDQKGKNYAAAITAEQKIDALPATVSALTLGAGDAIAFANTISIDADATIEVNPTTANGLVRFSKSGDPLKFQASGDAELAFGIHPSGTVRAPIELADVTIEGTVDAPGESVGFVIKGTAQVTAEKGGEIRILSGNAGVTQAPVGDGFRLELQSTGDTLGYVLVFDGEGTFPFEIPFATKIAGSAQGGHFQFIAGTSAIVPITLRGLPDGVIFDKKCSVVPTLTDVGGQGFLPASGLCEIRWKTASASDEGKLFFSTTANIDTRIDAGLVRQHADITFTVLQGSLPSLVLALDGPGEVVGVEGTNVVAWTIVEEEGSRKLSVELNQPLEKAGRLLVRSQTPLGDFPAQVAPLRVTPENAIRHSGHVRLWNGGAVRLDVTGVQGMSQSAPEQFPGGALKQSPRQVFVYRFPSADYAFQMLADQILPEVGVFETTVYAVTETDRVIEASIELDIREAPVREWEILVPDGYSVVEAKGAAVADHSLATQVVDGARSLKVLFGSAVSGRQLIQLRLEQNVPAAAGAWVLPPLRYADAKTVRGQIGIASAPGFRIVPGTIESLSELPLASFQKRTASLQHAYRIREANWTAGVTLEALGQSIQADVFHLYLLNEGAVSGSALVNYFVVGSPASEWRLTVPSTLENVDVDGQDVQGWTREGEEIVVRLHQPVLGASTLLVTYEIPMSTRGGTLNLGQVQPLGVQGERGYVQAVSPSQVNHAITASSPGLLKLEALELPAEFRLLSAAPALATYQYSARPFNLAMQINWFDPGKLAEQVVDFAKLESRVARDGQMMTTAEYYVKSRSGQTFRLQLPDGAKLWDTKVAYLRGGSWQESNVTARRETTDGKEFVLVPQNATYDPGTPVKVTVRLAQATGDQRKLELVAPAVFAPTLLIEWTVRGDEGRQIVHLGGSHVSQTNKTNWPNGYDWLQRKCPPEALLLIAATLLAWLFLRTKPGGGLQIIGLLFVYAAVIGAAIFAFDIAERTGAHDQVLVFSGSIVEAGSAVTVELSNGSAWVAYIHPIGAIAIGVGLFFLLIARPLRGTARKFALVIGVTAVAAGLLAHGAGAAAFFAWGALALFLFAAIPLTRAWGKDRNDAEEATEEVDPEELDPDDEPPSLPASTALIAGLLGLSFLSLSAVDTQAADARRADAITQSWNIAEGRLSATVEIALTAKAGETFVLLKAPAILTDFQGDGLRVSKREIGGVYMLVAENDGKLTGTAKFERGVADLTSIAIPTGDASIHTIDITLDKPGWEFASERAVRVEASEAPEAASAAKLILRPQGKASILMRPKVRDASAEDTKFFAETANAFVAGPGVVDARHLVTIRPSQGTVERLELTVPEGFTVSDVSSGPVGRWRFDPESRTLAVEIEGAPSKTFGFLVQSQMATGNLPVDVKLSPLMVSNAAGQLGSVGLAFAPDAQPEAVTVEKLSKVNIADFRTALLENDKRAAGDKVALRESYRFGNEGGSVSLSVAPVTPEVRAETTETLSLSEERLVHAIDLSVDITRAGLFKLTFPLPDEFDVEGASGDILRHWTEATEGGQRIVTLHLNGRTLGKHALSLSLAGPAPAPQAEWTVPKFILREATRQNGRLTITPERGIRIRPVSRQSASQLDSRELAARQAGTLSFRLLQADWEVKLQIEALDPWVTIRAIQDVTLREGITQTRIHTLFKVENAAIRALRVALPGLSDEEQTSVRASGTMVSDMVRIPDQADLWEIRFKRGVLGSDHLDIEYQRPSQHGGNGQESIAVPVFEGVRLPAHWVAVHESGRLDLTAPTLPAGWQSADWVSVPDELRSRILSGSPSLVFRVAEPEAPIAIRVARHEIADSLKLRVERGRLTSLISPQGATVTELGLAIDVVEQSTLQVQLPSGSALFSVFVDGQSVATVLEGDTYRFNVAARDDAGAANVFVTYATPNVAAGRLALEGPRLNIPFEQATWQIVIPDGYDLRDIRGSLEKVKGHSEYRHVSLENYLAQINQRQQADKSGADQLLTQANAYLQQGQQKEARAALSRAWGQQSLDEASNEDALVQLRALQTQQAVVGLNTRRQRLYLDNLADQDSGFQRNEQLEEAAGYNAILKGDLNYKPQDVATILRGNSMEETRALKRIASRIVSQQLSADTTTQAIKMSLPARGRIVQFERSVQVDGSNPLELSFDLKSRSEANPLVVAGALLGLVLAMGFCMGQKRSKA